MTSSQLARIGTHALLYIPKRLLSFAYHHAALFDPVVRLLQRHPTVYRKVIGVARGTWQAWGMDAVEAPEPDMTVEQLTPGARQIYDQLRVAMADRHVGRG